MKTVLIITYYWPPAGGPGVQRWLKFVNYLPKFGIKPVVYIPSNPFYPQRDESLLDELPDDIQIISRPIREPYNLAGMLNRKKTRELSSGIIDSNDQSLLKRLLLFIRGNLFIPDARVGWVKPSVRYLKKFISENPVDWLITTGPPHSLHLIGHRLKQKTGINWLADFRDPWTSIHYHNKLMLMKYARQRHKKLERKVLSSADHIVVTSPSTKTGFKELTDRPVTLITNGFDSMRKADSAPKRFVLAHIGSMLSERNPVVLWAALSELLSELTDLRGDLELQLVGDVSEQVVNSIRMYGLKEQLVLKGYVSHQTARKLQSEAAVLLLVESDRPETRAIIPGKLYEYMASGRPILAIGPAGSDIKAIIDHTDCGNFYDYSNKQAIKSGIMEMYERFRQNELNVNPRSIKGYSREELTRKLAAILT